MSRRNRHGRWTIPYDRSRNAVRLRTAEPDERCIGRDDNGMRCRLRKWGDTDYCCRRHWPPPTTPA